jgi:hypothetical protein
MEYVPLAGFGVTWSASGLPAGVTVNSATGVLTAAASPDPANGTYSIVLTGTETTPLCPASAPHTASATVSLTVSGR